MSVETLHYLLPEVILVFLASIMYLAGAFVPGRGWSMAALAVLLIAAAALAANAPAESVPGPVTTDLLAQYGRWLALLFGLLLVLVNWSAIPAGVTAEYQASLVLATAGLMLTATASDLVLLFVALELISIPTYLLLYLGRAGREAKEAAAKYFYLSVLSSAVLLYGFSFLYGMSGSTHLPRIQAVLAGQSPELAGLVGLAPLAIVLVFAGLGFRMAAVPFQFYAPDVYQGTSHGNAAMLSVLPKAAGLFALVRIVGCGMPGQEAMGWKLAMILGALSMTLGNILALWQQNLRRLLAYSSIAHVGYMMIGVATGFALGGGEGGSLDGFGAMLFYLAIYAVATTGIFAALVYLGGRESNVETIDDLAGASRNQPLVALALAIFLFSLAGVPPLAGFWGKLTLFFTAIDVSESPGEASLRAWFVALAVLGVVNAAIAATYYLRIIAALWFRPAVGPARREGGFGAWAATVIAAALIVETGLLPGPLARQSNAAGRSGRHVGIKQVDVATGRSPEDRASPQIADRVARDY